MTTRIGLYLQDNIPLKSAIKYVQYAESRGFYAVWQAESRLARDAIVPLAAYAAHTSRIYLGTGVTNIWTRNAATLASTFYTLDDLAPDRIICGLGVWHEPLASKVGVSREKYLIAMREVVAAVRGLLARETVTMRGQWVNLTDVQIDAAHGRQTPRHVPVYIAATGAKLMALAGEIADGVLLNYLVTPEYTADAVRQLEIGATQGGRTLDQIERPQLIVCSVDSLRERALERARPMVAQYIRQQPLVMRANGVRADLIERIEQALPERPSAQQIEQAAHLVPDEVIQAVTASGTPDECRAKIQTYLDAGATYPVLYPLNPDIHSFIDIFAYGY